MSTGYEEGAMPGRSNELDLELADFFRMARNAVENGQFRLAVCLYLVAFEQDSVNNQSNPTPVAVACLKKAWGIACDTKDRAMAEHIFERIEPHLDAETAAEYSRKLQVLSLEKLEDFGISHDDVEGMADMLTGAGMASADGLVKLGFAVPASADAPRLSTVENELVSPGAPYGLRIDANKQKPEQQKAEQKHVMGAPPAEAPAGAGGEPLITYRDLAGYDQAVKDMIALGIGSEHDARYAAFLNMLSRRHGVDPRPAALPLVFRAKSREDATYFMHATAGELAQPSVRMHVDTTSQGLSMLSVSTTSDFKTKQQLMNMNVDKPMTLVLEDVDLWFDSLSQLPSEGGPAAAGTIEHGMREAIAMIRPAVMNPNVTVLASCSSDATVDSVLFGILEPAIVVDIDLPNEKERADLWEWLSGKFPSLRYLDHEELTRLSGSLTRFDICSAAGEAVDQAYRESLSKMAYVPVTKDNLYEKIAAYQPLESEEFKEVQELALERFRRDLDRIDDILSGDA